MHAGAVLPGRKRQCHKRHARSPYTAVLRQTPHAVQPETGIEPKETEQGFGSRIACHICALFSIWQHRHSFFIENHIVLSLFLSIFNISTWIPSCIFGLRRHTVFLPSSLFIIHGSVMRVSMALKKGTAFPGSTQSVLPGECGTLLCMECLCVYRYSNLSSITRLLFFSLRGSTPSSTTFTSGENPMRDFTRSVTLRAISAKSTVPLVST